MAKRVIISLRRHFIENVNLLRRPESRKSASNPKSFLVEKFSDLQHTSQPWHTRVASWRLKDGRSESIPCSELGGDLLDLGDDSLVAHLLADLLLTEPLLALGVLEDKGRSSLDLLADGGVLSLGLDAVWVLSDGSVGSLVDILERLATESPSVEPAGSA